MRKFVRPPKPEWFNEQNIDKDRVLQELLTANQYHCAYTDNNYLRDFTAFEIEHFIPQSIYPNLKNDWNNLFPVDRRTNQAKGAYYNEKLLRPDAEDYEFDKYFIINTNNGIISPNPDTKEEDKERAFITINILGLNNPSLVQARKSTAKFVKENIETVKLEDIDELPFRFMVEKILADFAQQQKAGFISEVNIQNFHCIQNISVTNLGDKKEIYFLGENGDGKTLLLQAFVLLFQESFLTQKAETAEVADASSMLKDLIHQNPPLYAEDGKEKSLEQGWLENLFAYGVSRNQTNGEHDKYGFLTLFDKRKTLRSPIEWLLKLKLEEGESGYLGMTTEKAIKILENLTDNNVNIRIKGANVLFNERGFEISFEQLSEGYRSVLIWVTDLVSRLSERQPNYEIIHHPDDEIGYNFHGIVIVDEVNLHLHPKWEYKIVRKLRKWFPNIQFFFTTHSPMTILGASEDAVFYRLYKENGITYISEPYFAKDMDNWLANVLITSPLFDLESAHVAFFNEEHNADTSEDSLTSQIRKTVKMEVERIKHAQNTTYFSREKIQGLINQALQNVSKKS